MVRSSTSEVRAPRLRMAIITLFGAAAVVACADQAPTDVTLQLPIVAAYSHGADVGMEGKPFDLGLTQEITTTFTGDPDGVGTVLLTVNAGLRTVCWVTSVSNIALPSTGAHIHKAPAGVAGPIVLPLSAPDATGIASGCAEDVDRDLLRDILSNTAAYYVNVHSTEYRPGAIRSQLK